MLNLAEKTAHSAPELFFVITIDGIPYDDPEEVTQRLLEAIKRRAVAKWGDRKWELELIRAYCNLYQTRGKPGDEKATIDNRRSQIRRIFETWSCTLETAIALAACVGCKVQLSCFQVEVEEF
jgi:hypothetical protein